jgi:hypothetical protein
MRLETVTATGLFCNTKKCSNTRFIFLSFLILFLGVCFVLSFITHCYWSFAVSITRQPFLRQNDSLFIGLVLMFLPEQLSIQPWRWRHQIRSKGCKWFTKLRKVTYKWIAILNSQKIPMSLSFRALGEHILTSPPLDIYAFEKALTAAANKPSVNLARWDQAVAPFISGITSLSYAPQSQSSTGTPSQLPIGFVFLFSSLTHFGYITLFGPCAVHIIEG